MRIPLKRPSDPRPSRHEALARAADGPRPSPGKREHDATIHGNAAASNADRWLPIKAGFSLGGAAGARRPMANQDGRPVVESDPAISRIWPLSLAATKMDAHRGRRDVAPATLGWGFAQADKATGIATLVDDAYHATGRIKGWTSEAHLLGGQRIDAAMLADILRRDGSRILLACLDGLLGACIHLERVSPTVVALGLFAIPPALQGQGVGRSVIADAECWAKTYWGSRQVKIMVIDLRPDLVAWHSPMGYRMNFPATTHNRNSGSVVGSFITGRGAGACPVS